MKDDWVELCLRWACEPADFYSGNRKILRPRQAVFTDVDDTLTLSDCGYTRSKMTLLKKHYLHEESIEIAVQLWDKRCGQRKYGSVGFTCYNHFVKGGTIDAKRSKRASVFGPCIQSVTLTYTNDHRCEVDVFYRTTELFKKFPADLVFIRDELLSRFDFSRAPLRSITFHFANVTAHPMYFVVLIPSIDRDIIRVMEELKDHDDHFHTWVVKWSARYLVDEYRRGIDKFSQALKVMEDARRRIPIEVQEPLIEYLKSNHPGFRGE